MSKFIFVLSFMLCINFSQHCALATQDYSNFFTWKDKQEKSADDIFKSDNTKDVSKRYKNYMDAYNCDARTNVEKLDDRPKNLIPSSFEHMRKGFPVPVKPLDVPLF